VLIEVKVPQLSESVAEATLLTWHKKPGDAVKRDENLVDIETDKVVLETPAPDSGVIVKIIKGDGSTVTSNELIAQIDTEAKGKTAAQPAPAAAAVSPRKTWSMRPKAAPLRRRSAHQLPRWTWARWASAPSSACRCRGCAPVSPSAWCSRSTRRRC